MEGGGSAGVGGEGGAPAHCGRDLNEHSRIHQSTTPPLARSIRASCDGGEIGKNLLHKKDSNWKGAAVAGLWVWRGITVAPPHTHCARLPPLSLSPLYPRNLSSI